MQTYKQREEVPTEFLWDVHSVFASDEEWEQEYQAIKQKLPELEALKGTLERSADSLLAVLRKQDEIGQPLERLYVYASLRKDEDTTKSLYQGMYDRATQLFVRTSTAASYIEPEILELPQEKLEQFLGQQPALELYRQQLADLSRKRPHVRSAEVEEVLAATGEVTSGPRSIFTMINNADLKLPTTSDEQGEKTQLTQGNYVLFIRSSNRSVRKEAFEGMHTTFLNQRNTLASTLSAEVKTHIFSAQQRNYASSRERSLARYNIPVSVYDNLIETVHEHIPLMNRYLKLRKRVLGLDDSHMYDLYVPIIDEQGSKFSYQQASETIIAALAPLGNDYVSNLKKAFYERWIDVYETPGKRSGAYSGGAYDTLPFILLNFQQNRDSMYTLAHELGHSLHSYYTRNNQPYQYGDYTLFVAEVASTLNEGLLTEYLLKHTTDREERIALLNHSLEGIRGTLYRQTLFAEFEQMIHSHAEQGESLTADSLTAMYKALNEQYYGDETIVDDLIGIEWARIPHFYLNFYVYQYATGISAATALVQQILHEGQPAVERYLNFLKSGSSDYSIELLKKAGVDMTTPEPIRQTFQLFEEHLTQMEALIG